MKLKDCVTGVVRFARFINTESKAQPELWYVCENGFEFPIPLSETVGAEFKAEDKGMYFMRWIRPHLELVEKAKSE